MKEPETRKNNEDHKSDHEPKTKYFEYSLQKYIQFLTSEKKKRKWKKE